MSTKILRVVLVALVFTVVTAMLAPRLLTFPAALCAALGTIWVIRKVDEYGFPEFRTWQFVTEPGPNRNVAVAIYFFGICYIVATVIAGVLT